MFVEDQLGPQASEPLVPISASTVLVGAVPVVIVRDEIDIGTEPALDALLVTAFTSVRPPSPVVLDLTEVGFFGSSGLALLVRFHQLGTLRSTPLRVVASTRTVLRPIYLTELNELLKIHPTVTTALADPLPD